MKNRKNLLIVGPYESIHFQRWLESLLKLEIFDEIISIPADSPKLSPSINFSAKTKIRWVFFRLPFLTQYVYRILDRVTARKWRSLLLKYVVWKWRPNVIHLNEFNSSSIYIPIMADAKLIENTTIIISSWGSDLFMDSNIPSRAKNISIILKFSDILTAERVVEVKIARELDFKGTSFAPLYNSVGISLPQSKLAPTSKRKIILVKGYQDIPGRALNALAAIEKISSELSGFKILVFSASESVGYRVELMRSLLNLDIAVVPKLKHTEMLTLFGQSRLYIGISESDGVSTSMMEAMAMGSFPLQSINSGASDFIEDGVNGFKLEVWDIDSISNRIRDALTNDSLVDLASNLNSKISQHEYSIYAGEKRMMGLYLKALSLKAK